MKRILISGALVLALYSCGNNNDTPESSGDAFTTDTVNNNNTIIDSTKAGDYSTGTTPQDTSRTGTGSGNNTGGNSGAGSSGSTGVGSGSTKGSAASGTPAGQTSDTTHKNRKSGQQ